MPNSTTSTVMMIAPVQFRYNEQTARNNTFQNKTTESLATTQQKSETEFYALVEQLRAHGITVFVVDDFKDTDTPDSIFPNNWISTHADGKIMIYPMFAENRRKEVRPDIIERLIERFGYKEVVDWTTFVESNQFLEGTGSIVIDREHQLAYACISERTHPDLFDKWAVQIGFQPISFHSVDRNGFPIYHTNVMMAMAKNYCVICLESIPNDEEREIIVQHLIATKKEIIEISYSQLENFAGNMIELRNEQNESILVMSQAAYNSLSEQQIAQIEQYSTIISSAIPTIESNGGGSVRCMIAELFLPAE